MSAQATLVLIRHGNTDWNTAGRIQGHRDIALSDLGRRQARLLAQALAQEAFAAVYSSDLARAVETALPLAGQRGQDLCRDARLRERGFGLFEGSTYEEAQRNWPNEYAIWSRREIGYALPGGESYAAVRTRVLACLQQIVQAHAGGVVAVVTHGGILDIVYRIAQSIPWELPRAHALPNAAINRVQASCPGPQLRVIAWGERQHLDDTLDELA